MIYPNSEISLCKTNKKKRSRFRVKDLGRKEMEQQQKPIGIHRRPVIQVRERIFQLYDLATAEKVGDEVGAKKKVRRRVRTVRWAKAGELHHRQQQVTACINGVSKCHYK